MSKTIDEKVVEMKFDNKNFEANVQQSLSTLDKLKAKLNLSGASKGLENVQQSASKLSFSNAEASLAALEKRFSTTGIIGMTVIQNLTNSAMNMAKKLSSSALDSILGGGKRRATNLENARFQLEGLLKDAGKVEGVMKNVSDAVDGTAYSLDAAANVASQLAASGMEAGDQMYKSLRGVAGVAAMTNSSYEDIGRIYTQVAGQGRLMGDQLLQLSGRGMNAAATLAKYLNKTEAEIRDMTSKGKIDFATFAAAMDDAFGEHAKAANNTVNGAMANIKSALARIGALFYEPLIKQKGPLVQFLNEVRVAINGVKKSMEPIAEEITTKINKALLRATEIFKKFVAVLNWSPLVKFKDTLKGMSDTLKGTLKPINAVKDSLDKVKHTVEDYNKLVDQIIRGDFKNAPVRYQLLAEAGYDWAYAQNLVNERLGSSVRHATDFNPAAVEMTQNTENMVESGEDLVETLTKLSKEELMNKGYTEEQAEAIKTLGDVSKKTGISVKDLLNLLDKDQFDAKFLIFNSFKNVGMGLVTVLKSIGSALMQVFSIKSESLFDIVAAIHKFTQLFNDKIQRNAEGLTNTLKGLFSIIHLITSIVGGGFKIALKLLNAVLGAFNMNVLDLTGGIGELVFNFEQWLTKESGLVKVLQIFIDLVGKGAKKVKEFVENNKQIQAALSFVKDAFKNAGKAISDWFNNFPKDWKDIPKYIFEGLINGIKNNGQKVISVLGNFVTGLVEFVKNLLGIHSPSTVFFAIGSFIILGLIAGMKSQSMNLWDVVTEIGNKLIEFFKSLRLGDIVSVAISAGLIMTVNKILGIVNKIVDPLRGLNNMFNSLAGMFNSFGEAAEGLVKSVKYQGVSAIIKSVALSLGVLVAAIVVLGKLPIDELKQGSIALGAIVLVLTGFLGAIALMSNRLSKVKFPEIGKILAVTLGISTGIWLMAKALKNIGKIDSDKILPAIGGLAACVVGMGALVVVLAKVTDKLKGTKNIQKLGNVFLKISVSMWIMASALKKMSKVNEDDIWKMVGVFTAVAGLMTVMALVNKFSKNSITKIGETIQAISVALLLLVIAMKLSGSLKKENFVNGIKVIGVFIGFITALMVVSKIFKSTEMIKVTGSLLILVTAIGLLSLVMKLMSKMNPDDIKKGMLCVTGLGIIVGALVAISKDSQSAHGTTLVGVAAAIIALAAATVLLGLVDPEKVQNGIKAVGALSVFVALLVKATNGFDAGEGTMKTLITLTVMISLLSIAMIGLSFIDPKKLLPAAASLGLLVGSLALVVNQVGKMKVKSGAIKTLLLLTGIILLLSGIVAGLSMLPNINNAVQGAIAISALMGALVLITLALNKFDQRKKVNMKGILQLYALLPILAGLGLILTTMGNTSNAVQNAGALSLLLVSITGVLAGIGAIGKYLGGKALLGLVGLVALIGELFLVVQVLKQMDGLQNAAQNATILAAFTGVLTLVLLATAGVGAIYMATMGIAATGLLGLLALIGELFLVVDLLRQIEGIQNVLPNVMALSMLLGALTDTLVKIGIIGPLALIADVAIMGLIGAITTIGILATAVGALMEKFPQLQDFLNKGLPVLEQIAGSIGRVLGNLVGGFMTGVADGLPEVGKKLSEFMTNALPFITIAQTINESLGRGVGYLSSALFSLIGANLLDSIVKFISNGESFARLGTELTNFATNAKPFMDIMGTVDPNIMQGAKAMADAVLSLTAGNLLDTITGWLTGEHDMSAFGSELGSLGTGLSQFIANLQGFDESKISIVDAACQALKSLSDTAKEIPATGGLWQVFSGEHDLAGFSVQLPLVAAGITGFVSVLTNGGFTDDKINVVKAGCEALKCLAEVAKAIPASDGFWQWLSGKQDLEDFASKFPKVAEGIMGFVNGLKDFSNDAIGKVNSACNVMWAIKDLSGIDLGNINDKINQLGDKLKEFANKLGEFSSKMNEFKVEDIESAKNKFQQIIDLASLVVNTNTEGLAKFSSELSKFGTESIKAFVDALNSAQPKSDAEQAIINIINAVLEAANNKRSEIENKSKELAEAAGQALLNNAGVSKAEEAGKNFAQGFANGINNHKYLATNAGSSLGNSAYEAARKSIDSHSPSKKTYKLGTYFDQGFINGIKSLQSKVFNSSYSIGERAKAGLSKAISRISDAINSDIDAQPTIRPVLDLTDLENGSKSINSMFNNPSIALATNLGAISSGMNNRQNGNEDVVAAINKLGKTLSGVKGDTYNVNGVTYDDGSAISDAVGELVRAARVERRR